MQQPDLWLHQEVGINLIESQPGTGVFFDMGCGKTRTLIEAFKRSKYQTLLILCPKSAVDVWIKEAGLYYPELAIHQLPGTGAQKAEALKALIRTRTGKLAVVVHYDVFWRDPLKHILKWAAFDIIACDESQRIKAAGSKSSKFAYILGKKATKRVCLSGTPLEDKPVDAYGQFRFMDPTVFGSKYSEFLKKYVVFGGKDGRVIEGYRNMDEFKERYASISITVRSEDVQELPEQQDLFRLFDLPPGVMNHYRKLRKELIIKLEAGDVTAANALVASNKLHQLCGGSLKGDGGVTHQVDDTKLRVLVDTLEDIPGHEPVVVFFAYREDLARARHALTARFGEEATISVMAGGVNELADWQAGRTRFLLVNLGSGAAAVDMTRACYAIYFSVTHSLGDLKQSRKRLHRPGQTRKVKYIHLQARGTVDESYYKLLTEKGDVVGNIMEAVKYG